MGAGVTVLGCSTYFKAMLVSLVPGSRIHGMEEVVGSRPSPSPGYAIDGESVEVYAGYGNYLLDCCHTLRGIPPFAGFWSKDEILGVLPLRQPISLEYWLANCRNYSFMFLTVLHHV